MLFISLRPKTYDQLRAILITVFVVAILGVIVGIIMCIIDDIVTGVLVIVGSIVACSVTFAIYNDRKKKQTGKRWKQPDDFEKSLSTDNPNELKSNEDRKKISEISILPESFEYQEKYRTQIEYCQICKLEIRDKQMIRFCPYCKSYFHEEHLNEWLIKNLDCPVCNKPLRNE